VKRNVPHVDDRNAALLNEDSANSAGCWISEIYLIIPTLGNRVLLIEEEEENRNLSVLEKRKSWKFTA